MNWGINRIAWIRQPGRSKPKQRPRTTGAAYLKIPLPETENIKTVFAALGDLPSQAAAVVKTK